MEWTEGFLFLHSFYSTASSFLDGFPLEDDKAPSQVQFHVISQQAGKDYCNEEESKAIAKPAIPASGTTETGNGIHPT